MKKASLLSLAALTLLASCGHHRDVRPGANNQHSVNVRGEDEEATSREALAQANHYCGEFDKSAAIVDESTKYVGDMSEDNYKTMKTASKVGGRIGGAVFTSGSKNATRDGSRVYTGAGVLSDIAGEGYVTRMRFRCQ